MLLENKTAVIYGGGGALGGAIARAFAWAGARVHLAGRSTARLEKVANDIGDAAGVAALDALDERAVVDHADAVAADAGGIDVALNAVSFPFVHDTPFAELAVEEVMRPVDAFLRTNLITTKAVARHMTARGSGTILTLSAGAARVAPRGSLGYGTTCAAIEAMTQRLAVELGPSGVRVVCLRPHLIADAPSHGSYTGELFGRRAAAAGVSVEQLLAQWPEHVTLLGRLPTLAQVADAAAFLASDGAGAITGAVVDLTCGNAVRTGAGALVGVLD
ncbi:MAG TPA: SDR family oxidoreductase [Acidimicrobiales bacterium]|nr:SDR family oxidoreductase [Acidimicrobiales bacterium]